MGYRTVVILNNDLDWIRDENLGRKIFSGACRPGEHFQYGAIVEQVHADVQTLAIIDGHNSESVCHTHWYPDQSKEAIKLEMLKQFVDKLGYRLVKKSVKKV